MNPSTGTVVLAVAGCLMAGACGAEGTLARVQREGFVRVGYAVEAPYAYVEDGIVTGESPEVARAAVRALGVDSIVWVRTDFGSLIDELERGRFDIIAAGMFVTPERAMRVAFTRPSFCVGAALVVPAPGGVSARSLPALAADATTVLAVLEGSVEADAAERAGMPARQLLRVPDERTGLVAVRQGVVSAFALSAPSARRAARDDTALAAVHLENGPAQAAREARHCGALAVRRTDTELLKVLNRRLAAFVRSAEHRQLLARFGFTTTEAP